MNEPNRVENQPSWFEAADEIILDYIAHREPTSAAPLEDYTSLEYDYIAERLSKLEAAGLISRRHTNVYGLTEKGRDYINGDRVIRNDPSSA